MGKGPCAMRRVLFLATLVFSKPITISNILPRRDATGALMDAHDGTILLVNGTYFLWGMSYGDCPVTKNGCEGLFFPPHCGFRNNHSVSLFTSPDLQAWTFVGDALPPSARPDAVYFRPQVQLNARTQKFVLWINRVNFFTPGGSVADYFNSTYLVAETADPLRPFAVVAPSVQMHFGGAALGDLALFADPADGAGYVAYASWDDGVHAVSIDALTADFHGPSGPATGAITPAMFEAPLLFKRGAAHYLVAGPVCCFCAEGAASQVWTSVSGPLGPWRAAAAYIDPPGAAGNASLLGAQSSLVLHAPLAGGGEAVLWAGDRWASAPDGLFSHNLQFWGALAWNESASPPLPLPLAWANELRLDLAVAEQAAA